MGTATIPSIHKQEEKKKFVRRSSSDGSQRIRRIVQWLFVALNGWLGIQFLLWVRFCERGARVKRATTRGSRGLAAHRGLDEYEIFPAHGTRACNPARGHGPVYRLYADEPAAQESLLFLALPRWNAVGASMEASKTRIRPESASTKMVGYPITRAEVPASWLLCLRDRRHVRRGNPRFHVHTLRSGRRCQDAEFLPRYRANSGNRHRFVGAALYADPELLVPVSLFLRSAAGNHIASQSGKDPPRRRGVHRLRETRASLSFRRGR